MKIVFRDERQKKTVQDAIAFYDHLLDADADKLIDDFLAAEDKNQCDHSAVETAKLHLKMAFDLFSRYDARKESPPFLREDYIPRIENWDGDSMDLSEDDLRKLNYVLDAYSRFIMTQWIIIREELMFVYAIKNKDAFDMTVNRARGLLIPDLKDYSCSGNWGLCYEMTPLASKISYEMHGDIRHFIWKKQNANSYAPSYTVASSPPLRVCGIEPIEIFE